MCPKIVICGGEAKEQGLHLSKRGQEGWMPPSSRLGRMSGSCTVCGAAIQLLCLTYCSSAALAAPLSFAPGITLPLLRHLPL
eukprot:scaffold193838_cov15-Tisochrysis_lutea.AAC.1